VLTDKPNIVIAPFTTPDQARAEVRAGVDHRGHQTSGSDLTADEHRLA
jgi:hypothetical protein